MEANYLAENFVTLAVTAAGFVGFCFGVFYKLKRNMEITEETKKLVKNYLVLHQATHDKVIVTEQKVTQNTQRITRIETKVYQ